MVENGWGDGGDDDDDALHTDILKFQDTHTRISVSGFCARSKTALSSFIMISFFFGRQRFLAIFFTLTLTSSHKFITIVYMID